MINSIRSVRRAKGLTLEEVALRCAPPTTAQTIGRLETGTRTLSLGWLNRIAAALEVEPRDLVQMPDDEQLTVAAIVGSDGTHAPTQNETIPQLRPEGGMTAVRFTSGVGDYRGGDVVWCRRLTREHFASALNRDVLVPRPGGRYVWGRLLALDADKIQVLPLTDGGRQQVFAQPDWLAVAVRLVRNLGQ